MTVAGDSALNIGFGTTIDPATSARIRLAAQVLTDDPVPGMTELIPTFCSLMVCYDPMKVGFDDLVVRLQGKLRHIGPADVGIHRITVIPVCYGGEYGPDLEDVAAHAGLSVEEVVRIHTAHDYLIDMLGFLPGFAYLGGLDPRIHTPRLETPRTSIPAGSVGIGGEQTGVYPLASPGGWRIIGRTPVRPYDPDRAKPILYVAGEYLRFVPIDAVRYLAIEKAIEQGVYTYEVVVEEG